KRQNWIIKNTSRPADSIIDYRMRQSVEGDKREHLDAKLDDNLSFHAHSATRDPNGSSWRAKVPVDDSPKRLASPTRTAVWTPNLTRCPVKLSESSNGQIWPNRERSEYLRGIGLIGLSLIVLVYGVILFPGVAGLILEVGIESKHVSFGSATFGEKPEFAECTRRLTKKVYNFVLHGEVRETNKNLSKNEEIV
ncbi:hypothetical protein H5410_030401, partial [Solanum commersonii]